MYIIICVFFILLFWAFIKYSVDTIELKNYTIENEKIPKSFDGYNIVQIGDLHSKSFGKDNSKLFKIIESINPDIVVFTGDLVNGENNNYDIAFNFFEKLTKLYKVYYIIGNHEQKALLKAHKEEYKKYFEELYKLDFVNLDNQMVEINKGEESINIYGLTIPYKCYRYFGFDKDFIDIDLDFINNALKPIEKNKYNILLAHTPFYFEEYEKWGADLILSGHVHGGIIRIPFVGGLLSPNREFFPKYSLGKYILNKSTMIVTKGLGGSKVIIRINCRPEVVNIKLKVK